ncbi:MAG: hypothetical protein OXD31_12220 [Chloroflexi bacterium]|nr:hypothetical protein [Chloroflexota bacterium]
MPLSTVRRPWILQALLRAQSWEPVQRLALERALPPQEPPLPEPVQARQALLLAPNRMPKQIAQPQPRY